MSNTDKMNGLVIARDQSGDAVNALVAMELMYRNINDGMATLQTIIDNGSFDTIDGDLKISPNNNTSKHKLKWPLFLRTSLQHLVIA